MRPLILVVEDEPPLQKLLAYNLEAAGFEVGQAYDGEEAVTMIEERAPDLVLLDWMLPQLSGLEVCRRLRRRTGTAHLPIIMLTARDEELDRLRGLDVGADDFIAKPFSPAELVARVRAVLRRVRPAFAEQMLAFHDLRMDLAAHRVFRAGREVHLSPTEFRLLRHLLEHPGRVFSRAQLLDRVWGSDLEIELRTVDATIRRLRRALNAGDEADLLRTVRAEGYALDHKFSTMVAEMAASARADSPSTIRSVDSTLEDRESAWPGDGSGIVEAILPDELWAVIAPLLPPRPSRPETGRPALDDQVALAGILFVLKAGIGWEMLPKEMGCGSGSACQRRLREWQRAGAWEKVRHVLMERTGWAYNVNWSRAAAGGVGPLAQEI